MKTKKINQLTIDEINQKLVELQKHDKTLNSLYANHLIQRKNYLNSLT